MSNPDLGRKIARGIAWTGAAQAAIGIADFISILLTLALFVSTEDWGTAATAMLLFPVLDTLADSGIANSVIQRDDHTPEKLATVFWMNLGASSVLCGLTLLCGPMYGRLWNQPVVGWLLMAYGGKLVLQNAYQLPVALLRKQMRFEEVAKMRVVAHFAESISRPMFAALGATIWCGTLAALLRVVVISIHAQIVHPYRPLRVFRPRLVADYIRFAIRNAGSQLLYYSYTNVDYFVVRAYFGDSALGIYTLAFQLVLEPVRSITNVVADVALPTFVRVKNDAKEVAARYAHFVRLNLIGVLPFLVILFCCTEDIMLLTSSKWTTQEISLVALAVKILCGVGLLRSVGFLGPPLLDGMGRPGLTLSYMVTAAASLTATFFTVAHFTSSRELQGLINIAWAWLLGYPAAFCLLAILVARVAGVRWGQIVRDNLGVMASCAIALAVGELVRYWLIEAALLLRGVTTLATVIISLVALLWGWQKITISSMKSAMK